MERLEDTDVERQSTRSRDSESMKREKEKSVEVGGEEEINYMDWNGPNDPDNPLNWSKPLIAFHAFSAAIAMLIV